jgi:hypothetical protein
MVRRKGGAQRPQRTTWRPLLLRLRVRAARTTAHTARPSSQHVRSGPGEVREGGWGGSRVREGVSDGGAARAAGEGQVCRARGGGRDECHDETQTAPSAPLRRSIVAGQGVLIMPGPWASPHAAASGGASPCARSAAPAAAAMHQSAASRSGPSGAAYALPHRAERPPSGKPARKRSCEAGGSQRSCAGTESSAAQAARAQLAQLTAERAMLALHNPPDLPQPAESAADSFSELPHFEEELQASSPRQPPCGLRRLPCSPLAHSFPAPPPPPPPPPPNRPPPPLPSNFPSPPSVIPSRADPSGSARRKCPTTPPGVRRATKLRARRVRSRQTRSIRARADLWHAPVAWTREFLSSRKRSSNSTTSLTSSTTGTSTRRGRLQHDPLSPNHGPYKTSYT